MDEFTFPTIAAAEEQDPQCHHLPFPHFATSPLWFPSSSPALMEEASRTEKPEEAAAAAAAAEDVTVADENKMDLLWETFNEELHRADTGSELSDRESEMGRPGCMPMLTAASRARGVSRCRSTSWVLLLRIFRKLFVIEKTVSSSGSSL